MGWLFLLAFFVVGLPLLPAIVDLVTALVRLANGKPLVDNEMPCCPSCMLSAKDPAARYCSCCGLALTHDYIDRVPKASRTRLFIVAMAGAVLVAALFAAFKLSGAEQKLSRTIDPKHPPTISFGTSSAPADDDKGVKWEIRLQRK